MEINHTRFNYHLEQLIAAVCMSLDKTEPKQKADKDSQKYFVEERNRAEQEAEQLNARKRTRNVASNTGDESKTFFSYARADSEFALKLAEALRSAGINVWLDQLDIPPGVRWDDAIQSALENSPRVLVVLSPASASSDNVKDEISLALDTQKSIIPILLKDCTIPLRIRRFQHIDFRADYENALKRLIQALKQ